MKVFISQPMRGLTEEEINIKRQAITDVLTDKGYTIINSMIEDTPEMMGDNLALFYLGKSLMLMSQADIVYFAKGWQNTRGCKIERQAAEDYGLQIIDE